MVRELVTGVDGKRRCFGGQKGKEFYGKYHDEEWGVPVYNEQKLFELLILESMQAGLSWECVLKKRDAYRTLFCGFDPCLVAQLSDEQLEKNLQNPGIIRHRQKVFAIRHNARVFLSIQKELESFSDYAWSFIGGIPQINRWELLEEVPVTSSQAEAFSRDLKKRGMVFVGAKIIYSFMQAVGMVNDHCEGCWIRESCSSTLPSL